MCNAYFVSRNVKVFLLISQNHPFLLFQVILLSTFLCSFGVYSPIVYFVSIREIVVIFTELHCPAPKYRHLSSSSLPCPQIPLALAEGLRDEAVLLQTFIGLGMAAGTLIFGVMVVSRSKQCIISRQYLLQTSIFGIGFSTLALCSLEGYNGYLLFVWLYGVFLGGFHYVLKVYTFERIRAKHFPRGWSFVQGARSLPILIGLPVTGYMNTNMTNNKAGFYFSFLCVTLGGLVLFFMDWWKKRGRNSRHQRSYCDLQSSGKYGPEGASTAVVEHKNLSQKLSDVHNSVVGGNSVILRYSL